MKYFTKIEGDRVFLSPINLDDVELYTKWMNDLSTMIYLGNSSEVYSLMSEREALEGMATNGYNFAIVLKDGEKLLGNCSIFNRKPIHRTAEVGLFIGEEEYRGKGYGSEALELLIGYGFKILNVNNIMLRVFSFNTRAIKSYEKIGFQQFGKRTSAYYLNGKYHDEIYMELLSSNFHSNKLDEIFPK